ncbi:lysM domain receptor-like kinase 4 [Aristolochia californica]|uniref:lysM domain receptor-like kinase 4 n=1 Tax=Aristolochia californica TaxID=171875 RepID=UPI0035DC043C
MGFQPLFLACFIHFLCCFSVILAQQPYERMTNLNCSNTDASSSVLGYDCNGPTAGCQAYLIFRSQPPYDSVNSISGLLGSDPFQLSQINSVSESSSFPINKEVIVPVDCSCSGQYYQANSSYVILNDDTLFSVANNTYQGLSTCQALQEQNAINATRLLPDQEINVPIRCACPSANQSRDGVKYLLTYTIIPGDTVSLISQRFDVETQSTLDANSLTDPTIFFPTTLLVPLQNQPSSSQTSTPPPPSSTPPPPSSSPPANKSSRKWVYVVIGVVLGLVILIATISLFFIIRRRKRTTATKIPVSSHSESSQSEKLEKVNESGEAPEALLLGDIKHKLKLYTFEELKLSTDNFSSKSKIRGSVYRGVIKGDYAAIKRINGDVSKEIDLLKKINHYNLIRLSGVCFNGGNWYLVYEFAENGPLHDWIHSLDGSKNLSWVQRAQISLDIANGLNYLHTFTEPSHVHKNINSSNVLLDANFRAKIANFGMARATTEQDGHVTFTRHIMGTKGYMAPEYLENGFISSKLDVYAFGVVLLEMISGKEAVVQRDGREMLLSVAFIDLLSKENAKEELVDFIDPGLRGDYPVDIVLDVARLIDRCLSEDAASRPTMDKIVQSLGVILAASLNLE